MKQRFECPCCGNLTLSTQPPGTYELCPVCYWEDDGVQFADPEYAGGANRESLNQARTNFREFGASSQTALSHVRPPLHEELPRASAMTATKAEAIALARKMLAGEVDLIEGCRMLVPLLRSTGIGEDPNALVIVGVESETDGFPMGAERAHWDPTALAAKDRERDEYLNRARPELLSACQAIIGRRAMTYLRVGWRHQRSNEPVVLYSELDENRFEVRKVEIFRDGHCGYASPAGASGGTKLGIVAVPELSDIARDPQFDPQEITPEEFEDAWARRKVR